MVSPAETTSSGPDADGGAGPWDLAASNWDSLAAAGTDTTWPAVSSGNDDAVFAGTAGIVTIDAACITANDITFNVAGYTITGGGLKLDSVDPDGPDPLTARFRQSMALPMWTASSPG